MPDLLPKPLENSARPGDTGRSNSIEWRARFLFQKDFLFSSSLSCLLFPFSRRSDERHAISISRTLPISANSCVTRHSRPRFIKHVSIWNARFRYELYISSVTSGTANDKIELPLLVNQHSATYLFQRIRSIGIRDGRSSIRQPFDNKRASRDRGTPVM